MCILESYPDVLNPHDLCEILRISPKTVYKLLQMGAIPYRKIGRQYKISKTALIEFIENNE